jgi:hypothetical protein
MNDQAQRLRAALAELERELQHLEDSDPETRAMLQSAAQDITAALGRTGASRMTATPDVATSKNVLAEKVLDFEASHPRLSLALSRLIDALGQLGI